MSAEAEIFVLEVHDGDGDVVSEHPHHVLGGVVQGAEAGVQKITIIASILLEKLHSVGQIGQSVQLSDGLSFGQIGQSFQLSNG